MNLKEDDVVMCTVRAIEGTTIFVDIEGSGRGMLMMSEVAAGRIRNLREYVSPNKKIVCKILKISPNQVELSLRRVTGKEREEVINKFKKEQTFAGMLKPVVKEPAKIIEKIKEKYELAEFVDQARENPKILIEFMKKEEAEKLSKILLEKREKEKEARKIITIKTDGESGVNDIQYTLSVPEVEIKYLGSSQFLITTTAKDFKEANTKINTAIEEMEKRAKERKIFFELKEK
ncbi:hypothetical protein KW805_02555 [Candidatus Pacearchaeota archaeon]|nr:hypothetical protein [Candidatus Pacearchaeota archaeon]